MAPIDDKSNKTLSKMVQLWTTNIHRATAWGGVDSPPKGTRGKQREINMQHQNNNNNNNHY